MNRHQVQLCSDHPTLLVFTAKQTCRHCQVVEPHIAQLIKDDVYTKEKFHGLGFHVKQFDTQDTYGRKFIHAFRVDRFPTFLVHCPVKEQNGMSNYRLFHYDEGRRTYDDLKNMVLRVHSSPFDDHYRIWKHVPNLVSS